MKISFKKNLLLWGLFLIFFFTIDFLRYHYKSLALIGVCYLVAGIIAMTLLYQYIQRLNNSVKGYISILFWILWFPLAIAMLVIPSNLISTYRERQLEQNHEMAVCKVVKKYASRNSYCIEFEFKAGDRDIRDKKYLEKEEWDRFWVGEETEIMYVPDLPLNNALK